MSADRFSLSEFSEFLDDTDGHRLAQFLQKKSGVVRPGRGRIFDHEPERFSLNVLLKRVSSPTQPPPKPPKEVLEQPENTEKTYTNAESDSHDFVIKEEQEDKPIQKSVTITETVQTEAVAAPHDTTCRQGASERSCVCVVIPSLNCSAHLFDEADQSQAPATISKKNEQPLNGLTQPSCLSQRTLAFEKEQLSEIPEYVHHNAASNNNQSLKSTTAHIPRTESASVQTEPTVHLLRSNAEAQMQCNSPLPNYISQPATPRSARPQSPHSPLSKVTRSGGLGSADRLRRQVLKRLSTLGNNGRRTLLKEFESTLSSSEFAPEICSTPMHHTPPENLQKTPTRQSNTPTAPHATQNVVDNPVAEILQLSLGKSPRQQYQQPFIRNVVESLQETIKKLNNFESSQAPDSSKNATVIPDTQELLQNAQVHTTASQQVNKSFAPDTQELLQVVQKALNDIQKSQVQIPKIVIPVNQTFNNAPAPILNEHISKDCVSVCETTQRAREKESERTRSPAVLPDTTFKRAHTSGNVVQIAPNIGSTNAIKNDATFTKLNTINREQQHHDLIGSNTRSRIPQSQTFAKQNKTHNKVGAHSLKGQIRQECRSPMLPINQITNTICPINQTKSPSLRIERLNESQTSRSAISKRNISKGKSVDEDLQKNVSRKIVAPPTNHVTLTDRNSVTDQSVHQVCDDRRNSVPTSRVTTLTNRNVSTENVAINTTRLRTAEAATSQLMTEDEDEEDLGYIIKKKRTLRKSGPLNLAAERPPPTISSRRQIKRLTTNRRKVGAVNTSPLITSDTETDSGPPPAHPLNLHHVKRDQCKTRSQLKRPLNKPPNTPKNGEQFADELKAHLARLTNHEILDLRKRSSMGKVLAAPTRLRKSTTGKKQVLPEQFILANQLQIEEQIQLEILRRDLLGKSEGLHVGEEEQNPKRGDNEVDNRTVGEVEASDELIFNELPSAPDEFQDNLTAMQKTMLQLTQRASYSSSLVDDNSSERVSFRFPNGANNSIAQGKQRLSRKQKLENLPEITKRYIEIHKKLRKRRKPNTSKRLLYTKGDSTSEGEGQSPNMSSEMEHCPHTPTRIEPIPPPPTVSPIHDLHVPSPPPPLALSPHDEYLSPPDQFLDSRISKSPAKTVNPSAKTLGNAAAATEESACQTAIDDAVFKKPAVPALPPKRKAKKGTGAKKARTDATTGHATITTDTHSSDDAEGVRRSKRGLVPRKQNFFLRSLFEAVENRSHKAKVNRMSRALAASSANNDMSVPVASSTVNKDTVSAKSRRGRKPRKNREAQMLSYLGDTNTTSGTVTSACSITENGNANRLRAIAEAPTESDDEVRAPEHASVGAPTTSDSEIPATATKNKAPIKAKAPRQRARSRFTKHSENVNKNQQQVDQTTENVLQANENVSKDPMEMLPDSQSECGTGTVNRSGVLEFSRVYLPPRPPLDKLNEMFDQLKSAANNSGDETTSSASHTAESSSSSARPSRSHTRQVRVRLRRLNSRDITTSTTASHASSSMSSTRSSTATQTAGNSSGNELLTWLKNVTHLQSATNRGEVYMDMRPSTAGRLFFTDLEGIDYAFYDTVEKSSLGYLRFKPLQSKPLKRTKKYHLHFVVLAGSFQIGTEREHGTFGVGDMVAINIGCRYKITNLDNDVGILMVIKK